MLEPDIEPKDMERIHAMWGRLTNRWGLEPHTVIRGTYDEHGRFSRVLTKEDCRTLLWRIDEEIAKCPAVDPRQCLGYHPRMWEETEDALSTGTKPYFVKKYLVSAFTSSSSVQPLRVVCA